MTPGSGFLTGFRVFDRDFIKIYSNIVKQTLVNTSLIDVPIYVNIGLDNTIMRNNVHIPIVLNSNQNTIDFYMINLYDEVISLSQPVYVNMSINFDEGSY